MYIYFPPGVGDKGFQSVALQVAGPAIVCLGLCLILLRWGHSPGLINNNNKLLSSLLSSPGSSSVLCQSVYKVPTVNTITMTSSLWSFSPAEKANWEMSPSRLTKIPFGWRRQLRQNIYSLTWKKQGNSYNTYITYTIYIYQWYRTKPRINPILLEEEVSTWRWWNEC